jgi:shikimate dehydrogenase
MDVIDASTRYCAVFGSPVRHSASPAMQNAALRELGLNWRYLAFEVDPGNLRAAIEGCRRMGFIGLNLTVPHKLLATEMVDVLDASAKEWGAVNTIRFEVQAPDGSWSGVGQVEDANAGPIRAAGFNTDAEGLSRSLQEDLGQGLLGAKVLVLGAGGAGRAAALKLAKEGVAELYLVNRSPDKVAALSAEIAKLGGPGKVTVGYPTSSIDLILNATSAGLRASDPLPYDPSQFDLRQASAAYDMIYRPAQTAFLRAAAEAGCRCANGLGMLLHQGARAMELWTGRVAPVELMRQALKECIYV